MYLISAALYVVTVTISAISHGIIFLYLYRNIYLGRFDHFVVIYSARYSRFGTLNNLKTGRSFSSGPVSLPLNPRHLIYFVVSAIAHAEFTLAPGLNIMHSIGSRPCRFALSWSSEVRQLGLVAGICGNEQQLIDSFSNLACLTSQNGRQFQRREPVLC